MLEHGRILVVDDNRINRMTLSRNLQQEHHEVILAEHGRQALELLKEQQVDVVLLDIIMPEMDGYEVLACIKADPHLKDLPVIVISALDEIDSAVRCIEMGAEDYLSKPFNPVLLRARLNACLQKKSLRDLEKAYLQQEFSMRQNEKLATLGRLSAGMAHELNNPTGAVTRGASQLREAFRRLQACILQLGALNLRESQWAALLRAAEDAQARAEQPLKLDPLSHSDRTAELEDWLDEQGVSEGWELAPNLVTLGYEVRDLAALAADVGIHVAALFDWLHCNTSIDELLSEVATGSARISELVTALKSYSYLDQAPIQNVTLHEGLDSTIVILQNKLAESITVHRDYDPEVPIIQAYGSELNQVWTHLIDNAIDALEGNGDITLRTRHDDSWAIVEIQDNGHGISEDAMPKLFDPFFTTKEPGSGTGMGLNTCYNIIVQKHQGQLEAVSEPDKTSFVVRLPFQVKEA